MARIYGLSCDVWRMFRRIILYVLVKSQKVRRMEAELSAEVRLFRPGVLNLGTIDVLGWVILDWWGSCPVYFKMFKQHPWPLPTSARSIPSPVVTTKNHTRHCQMSPGMEKHPQNYCIRKMEHFFSFMKKNLLKQGI